MPRSESDEVFQETMANAGLENSDNVEEALMVLPMFSLQGKVCVGKSYCFVSTPS